MIKKILCIITLILTIVCVFVSCDDIKNDASNTPEKTTHTHAFGEWKNTEEATCTTKGSKERYCSCGEKQTETIAVKGHTYGEWETIYEPTCTNNGTRQRQCFCGETEKESLLALSHNWIDASCVTPKYCKRCGKTDGVAGGHNYYMGQCTICNEKRVTGITWQNTPLTLRYAKEYSGIIYDYYDYVKSECIIDNITPEISWNSDGTYTVNFYVDGSITYLDKYIYDARFRWTVYDSEGYVIKTGIAYLSGFQVGSKFKKIRIMGVTRLDPDEDYDLYLESYYI